MLGSEVAMRRAVVALLLVLVPALALVGAPGEARAQASEGAPAKRSKKRRRAKPRPIATPEPAAAPEPIPAAPIAPAPVAPIAAPALAPAPVAVEKAAASAPPPAHPVDAGRPIPTSDPRVLYAVGLRARGLFVPGFLLAPFLDQYQALNSWSVGGEFVRRKGALDVVVSLDLSLYSPPDGNWLAHGHDPTQDTHFVRLDNLDFLSVDVALIWNHDLLPWLGFLVGGGLGLGVVLGDVREINNAANLCNAQNAGDPSQCHPISPDVDPQTGQVIGEIKPGTPGFQQQLDATARAQAACVRTGGDCTDTAAHPYWHSSTAKPPVLPVVNFVVGFRFKLHRHADVTVTGGFRNGFFVGLGPEYVF